MINKDLLLLQEAYGMVCENLDPSELIGKQVKFHPAQIGGLGNETFMKWSVFLNDKRVGYYDTIHLKDVYAPIDHALVKKQIIDTGVKAPNVYIYGTVIDIGFPVSEVSQILSSGGWNSITYNPHKHPEYVLNNSKIDKSLWCSKEWGFGQKGKESIAQRKATSDDFRNRNVFSNLDVVSKGNEKESSFSCKELLGKRHINCGEDYLWIKN